MHFLNRLWTLKSAPALAVAAVTLLSPAAGAAQEPQVTQAIDSTQIDSVQVVDSAQADTISVIRPETVEARLLLVALDSIYDRVILVGDSLNSVEGENAALLRVQLLPLVDSLETLKANMISELGDLTAGSPPVDSLRTVFQGFLLREFALTQQGIARRAASLDSLSSTRATTPLEDLDDLEEVLRVVDAQLDTTLMFSLRSLTDADAIGINTQEQWTYLDSFLQSRAAEQTGRLQLAVAERAVVRTRIRDAERADAGVDELAELETRRGLAEQRISRVSAALSATADLLDLRGIETAAYRQLQIQATGEVTSDVLNPSVALGLLRDWSEQTWLWLKEAVPNLLVQLALVLGSMILFRTGFRTMWWMFERSGGRKISRLLNDLLERMLMPIATVGGLGVGLTLVGVDPTALLTGIGVLGVIIGLALQDSLGNIASGIFILLHRPFDVDDIITTAGVTGTVKAMGLANTTIVTFDNRRLFVPNNKVWGEVIDNKSAEATRRVDRRVPIAYEEDLTRAIQVVEDVCAEYDLVLEEPATLVYVADFDDSAIELEVRAWTDGTDWWTVTTQLPRLIRLKFAAENIAVPYPRQLEENLPHEGDM